MELLLGQIPEAIYFALFMIYAKQLREKRILFTILMIIEYLLLKMFISYNIWFQISYTFMTYIILKILYKQKSQITDIFTFTIASIYLIIISVIPYFIIWKTINNYIIYVILNRIIMFVTILILNNRLYSIQKLYKKLWNRNDLVKKKIKTTTFRALNIVIFNVLFVVLDFLIYFLLNY